MSAEITLVPLNKLVRSTLNIRKTGGERIDDLAASIAVHGLLQNLTVTKTDSKSKGRREADVYEVVAGGRRLAALQLLTQRKTIPKDYPVPCMVVDDGAEELSLVENTVRQAMHPADQFEAFERLVRAGLSVEDVAARFGVTPLFVSQRLKLANVSPTLIELYRNGGIRLEQLEALAISNDHEAQERVWNSAHEWDRTPSALRRALTQDTVDSNDKRVLFVGLNTYLERGGGLERDLFDAEHEGYLTDPALLETLASEKLQAEADRLKADGWSWAEVNRTDDRWRANRNYTKLQPRTVPLSKELRDEDTRLRKELKELQPKEEADASPQDEQRIGEIDRRLAIIEATRYVYTTKQKSISGVMVGLAYNGEFSIDYGLSNKRGSKNSETTDEGGPVRREEQPIDPDNISGSLQEELTAQRTVALRAALMSRLDVALVAITHKLAGLLFYREYEMPPSAVTIQTTRYDLSNDHPVTIGSKADNQLNDAVKKWRVLVPESMADLWQWLIEQPQTVVLELLAFCVAQNIDAVRKAHQSGTEPHLMGADALSKALDFDMLWWAPTAENYFKRIKRGQILAAISEATGKPAPERLLKLKKADLAAEAEALLENIVWAPPLLRG